MVLNDDKLSGAEKYYRNLIDDNTKMCDDEERVNTEMEAYLKMTIAVRKIITSKYVQFLIFLVQEYEMEMERLMEDYKNETEERDLKIRVKKEMLAKRTSRLEEMNIVVSRARENLIPIKSLTNCVKIEIVKCVNFRITD